MVYLICTIAIIALGLFFTKSKFVYALIFFSLCIISTHFQSGNDLLNLEESYSLESQNFNELEDRSLLFYGCLIYLNNLGLSFYYFRCIDFAIWGFAFYILTFYFSKRPNYALSCCFFLPLLTFASQMRNGLAAAFLYLAITCLFILKKRKYGIIAYVLLVIIAGLFHLLGFIYLLGLLALLPIEKEKLKRYVIYVSVAIFFIYNEGLFFYVIKSDYYSQYGSGLEYNWFLFVSLLLGIIMNYKFSLWSEKIIQCNKDYFSETSLEFTQFTNRFYLIFMIFLPLLLVNGSIYRIYQTIFVFTAISVTNASNVYFAGGKYQGSIFRMIYFCFYILVTAFYLQWQGEFVTFFNSIRI